MVFVTRGAQLREERNYSTCLEGGNKMKWESCGKDAVQVVGHLSILMLDSNRTPGARKMSTKYFGQRLRAAYDSLSLRIWAEPVVVDEDIARYEVMRR